ncbi:hypothetical protein ATANTOWER_003218 [Ataeniobius toweri]|uniref:Uncharacterized protein n=1 Tax=Ataeniobius toweri TaxID=208326 RepID=A0ABU7C693_9TELE|nr:hypothetical protein [Ataeniobius toweri]
MFLCVRMRVGMYDCDCVPVFVSGWVLGCSLCWISLISSPPHSLLVAGVSASWCTCGSRCLGLCAWCVPAHSQVLLAGPLGSVRPLPGEGCAPGSRVSGSMAGSAVA